MADYKKILFPVDPMDVSPAEVSCLLTMARRFEAEIHLLHVVQCAVMAKAGYSRGQMDLIRVQAEVPVEVKSAMELLAEEHLEGYPRLTITSMCGNIREEIGRYAVERGMDLIIMGTRGSRGLERMLFGSVAQGVVQSARVPVMTVNPSGRSAAPSGDTGFEHILLPVDLTTLTPPSLPDHALSLARAFSARLHLLYVVRSSSSYYAGEYHPHPGVEEVAALLREEMAVKLDRFAAESCRDYPDFKTAVRSGHTARRILAYIDEENISAVVMGTHGRRGLDRVLFGSVAQRVVSGSPVPVMSHNPYPGYSGEAKMASGE